MFESNYKAEKAIKKWAKFVRAYSIAIMVCAGLAAFILLCIEADELWLFSIISLVGGAFSGIPGLIISELMWGFSEVVDNSNKIAGGATQQVEISESELPEL